MYIEIIPQIFKSNFKANCFSLTIPHKKDMEGQFLQILQELRHR